MASSRPSKPENSANIRPNNFTPNQKHIQQILAVTFASVSMLSALVTFYWFLRLKKIYRHHLIMLLIVSDMFKAMWYFIPALVILVKKPPISTQLCESAGFFLSVGNGASDFIILLIALHTLLSVLQTGKSSGLRPYRYRAYACWAAFAVVMPSLAFVNPTKDKAYISQGTYCFLPLRPVWYRLVLAWVPRYLILCMIAAIYVAIYVYTVMQFGKFDINLTSSTVSTAPRASDSAEERPTGLPRVSPFGSWFGRSKKGPQTTAEEHHPAPNDSDNHAPGLSGSSEQSRSDPSPARVYRRPTLIEALRDKNLLPFGRNGLPKDTNPTLRKRHKAIKRQLRYMFIYPLVYLLMWTVPFINHCWFYTKTHNPPFVLNCIALTCLCLQCAVDCLIFSIRERPWRCSMSGYGSSRSRQASAGGSIDIGMAELANRNGGMDISNPTPETSPAMRFSREAGRQPPERNWWDNEPM